MLNVLLALHLIVVIALIVVVLLQRSEGGALGIGGGGPGSMFSARGQANLLTRTTAILGASFMALSILLAIAYGAANRDAPIPRAPEEQDTPELPDDSPIQPFPSLPQ